MAKNSNLSGGSDILRYGERLQKYLPALKKITEKLAKITAKSNIDELLKKILPVIREVLNSQIFFIADENGIFFSDPKKKNFLGITLRGTEAGDKLVNMGERLVVDGTFGKAPELEKFNLNSMLVVHTNTPMGKRFIGVANGNNKPFPYIAEDLFFFNTILQLLSLGIEYGRARAYLEKETNRKIKEERERLEKEAKRRLKEETERQLYSDRYEWAHLRGEWEYLSRASEDYAKTFFDITEQNNLNEIDPSKNIIHPDNVLSDYLDAELSIRLRSMPLFSGAFSSSMEEDPVGRAGDIFAFKGETEFNITFKENGKTKLLKISDYPRTATAGLRIQLFLKPVEIKEKIEYMDRYLSIISELKDKDNITIDELYLDWIRIEWQYIYYLSSKGILEPLDKCVEKCIELYLNTQTNTVRGLMKFLENNDPDSDLSIDSDWLMCWLSINVLLSKKLNDYYDLIPKGKNKENKGGLVNRVARMRYLKNLSHIVLYVLHCTRHAMRKKIYEDETNQYTGKKKKEEFKPLPFSDVPIDPISNISMAQLYITSEYAYREIGVHRELKIFERLSKQMSYELPLYAASSFYRDHLYHVIDVCLFGEFLLRSKISENNSDIAESFKGFSKADLLKNWYVAALCHDLGYVIEQADKFIKPIEEVKGEGISELSKKVKDGLNDGKNEMREISKRILKEDSSLLPPELVTKLQNEEIRIEHGIVGWLHLRHWIKEVRIPVETFAPALTAILRHNLSNQEIDPEKEPLSFLLLLCDHLQEWGRPRIAPDPLAHSIIESLRFSDKPLYDKKIRMSKMWVGGLGHLPDTEIQKLKEKVCEPCIFVSDDRCALMGMNKPDLMKNCLRFHTQIDKKKGITFTFPYDEARETDFEPCISWLTFCRDFQGISSNRDRLLFPISIIFKHEIPHIWKGLSWQPLEMEIFEEFANKHSSYLCEWIELARQKQNGIEYEDNGGGNETFIIKLKDLDKPLKRGLKGEHWKDFFRWKWEFLGQKYIKSNLGGLFPDQ
ncbi:MAG: GAF domain-containing protein [Candidatus Omnitrophota bacterium]